MKYLLTEHQVKLLLETTLFDYDYLLNYYSKLIWFQVKELKKVDKQIRKNQKEIDLETNLTKLDNWKLSDKELEKETENLKVAEKHIQRAKYIINDTVRKFTNNPPEIISKRVATIFLRNFRKENPFEIDNHSQKRRSFESKYNVDTFMTWDHAETVSDYVQYFMSADSLNSVRELLFDLQGPGWITLDENSCLNKRGTRKSRPQGWRQAYKACNIVPLTERQYTIYRNQFLDRIKNR